MTCILIRGFTYYMSFLYLEYILAKYEDFNYSVCRPVISERGIATVGLGIQEITFSTTLTRNGESVVARPWSEKSVLLNKYAQLGEVFVKVHFTRSPVWVQKKNKIPYTKNVSGHTCSIFQYINPRRWHILLLVRDAERAIRLFDSSGCTDLPKGNGQHRSTVCADACVGTPDW